MAANHVRFCEGVILMSLNTFPKMMRGLNGLLVLACIGCVSLAPHAVQGQSKAEWPTGSGDQFRDGWYQGPSKITPQNVKNLELLWKVKIPVKTMGMQSFREPLLITGVTTAAGVKNVTLVVGASNEVAAIDTDTGKVIWQKKLAWTSPSPQVPGEGRGFICTNAQSATPVVTPAGTGDRKMYVLASDGYLHSLEVGSGDEKEQPIEVLPRPYGKPYGLNLVNNVIYTITGQGCSGVPNALYAVDLTTRKVAVSSPPQAGLWGVAGPPIGSDGTIYFESGDGVYDAAAGKISTSVLAFTYANGELKMKDYYTPRNYEWLTKRDLDMNSTSVIFPYKGRDVLVASGKEGRYILIDSKSMGGADHQTPLYYSPLFSNTDMNFQTEGTWGSMTSWLGKDGTRWVLAPIGGKVAVKFPITYGETPNGGIIAMKLDDKSGKPILAPAWLSRDMITAEPPVVVNGVVFTLAGGEFTMQGNDAEGGLFSAEQRIAKSKPAKLYALDAVTGKELFVSPDSDIASFLHQAGLSVAEDKVVFGTFDGTIYCYGLK
jgi:outer membrane protein assembly factor BamB